MKDRYTGDLGDFGKYGLLKALCGDSQVGPSLSLGVVWYLTPDEEGSGDGGHVPSDKNRDRLRPCDPPLFDSLHDIIERGPREVASIRRRGLLPAGTVYFEAALSFDGLQGSEQGAREVRLVHRERWFKGALDATEGCKVVFLDPDKGLEIASTGRHEKDSPQYVYFDELERFRTRGQSVVIYQHIHRKRGETAQIQIDQRFAKIREHIGSEDAFALLYHRGTARAFFVVPADTETRQLLLERSQSFVEGLWGRYGHFDLVIQPS